MGLWWIASVRPISYLIKNIQVEAPEHLLNHILQPLNLDKLVLLGLFDSLSARDGEKKVKFANSLDPDEAAHNELPHLDQLCLPPIL